MKAENDDDIRFRKSESSFTHIAKSLTHQSKQMLSLKLKDRDLLINVVDSLRSILYQESLLAVANVLDKILKELNLENTQLSFDHDNIIKSLFEYYATILDRELIECIDKELKLYREDKNINLSKIDIKIAEKHYKKFFKTHNLKEKIEGKYKWLFELYNRLNSNFIASIHLMLKRVHNDFNQFINPFFSPAPQSTTVLSKICASGSDFHKNGQQVMILHFNTAGQSYKVVYKPSPVIADALVTGKLKELATVDNNFNKHFCLFDILNENLDKDNKLSTWKIIPRTDTTDIIDIRNHYGYLEYLEHSPLVIGPEELLELALEKIYQTKNILSSNDEVIEKLVQKEIDAEITRRLYQESDNKKSNLVTTDTTDVQRYSFHCGMLNAVLLLFGGADFHAQNLIISKKLPFLIDLECFFTQQSATLVDIATLDREQGAMRDCSIMSNDFCWLHDVSGKKSINLKYLEKNHLFFSKDSHLESCNPILKQFNEGFTRAIKILYQQKQTIEDWFNLSMIKHMWVRVVPYPTHYFRGDIVRLRKAEFSAEKASIGPNGAGRKEYQLNLKSYQGNITANQHNQLYNVEPLPKVAVYLETHYIEIIAEISTLNIPVYYALVTGKKLYNSSNNNIEIPSEFRTNRENKFDFFAETPLDFISRRIQILFSNEEILSQFIKECEIDIDKLLNQQPHDKNFLMTLSVNDQSLKKEEKGKEEEEEKHETKVNIENSESSSDQEDTITEPEEQENQSDSFCPKKFCNIV